MTAIQKIRTPVQWFFAISITLVSLRFLIIGVDGMFAGFPEMLDHLANRKLALILHISAAPIALTLGLFQFLPRLRAKRPATHRWTGRFYVMAVVIGGVSGFVLALGMVERLSATLGFAVLSILWIGVTLQAIRLAMTGHITEHRRWMLRSYALTFAAVSLRLELPLFFTFTSMEYGAITAYVAWLAWIPNLIFIEWWLRRHPSAPALSPA